MKVKLLLCDAATTAEGKLNILGAGWSFIGPVITSPFALAVLIEVPWDRANQEIKFGVELRGADGTTVALAGPMGPQPIRFDGRVEVGRPPGHPHGVALTVPLALQIPALPLAPGRYSFELDVEGEPPNDEWHAAFTVRPAPQIGGIAGIGLPPTV